MKSHVLLGGGIVALLLASWFAYSQAKQTGFEDYAAKTNELDELLVINGELDKELFLIRTGENIAFDRLTSITFQLRSHLEAIDLPELQLLIENKLNDVESFKTKIAIFRNASRNSLRFIYRFNDPASLELLNQDDRANLALMSQGVLSSLAIRDTYTANKLKEVIHELNDVQISEPLNKQWITLVRHAKVTSSIADEVHALMNSLTSTDLARQINLQQLAAEQALAAQTSIARNWQLVLLGIVVLLIALLVRAVQLVSAHSRSLRTLNSTLEQRVADRTAVLEETSANLREALEENKEQQKDLLRLSRSVEEAADGIAILDLEQNVVFSNNAYANMLGYERSEIEGCKHPPADHLKKIFGIPTETRQAGVTKHFDCQFDSGDGQQRMAEMSSSTILDADKERIEYLVIAKDVSERRNLEQQLAQAQKLESIGQLAAGIAHEINTPTQYVTNNVQFFSDSWSDLATLFDSLRRHIGPSASNPMTQQELSSVWEVADVDYLVEEMPEALEQAKVGLEQIKQIVLAMKNFAHPGADAKEATDINAALADTITIAKSEWKYVADVETSFDESIPKIPAVRSALNQVYLNLIVNAAHAIAEQTGDTGEKGLIAIKTQSSGAAVQITIEDNGGGIPQEIQSRIFDPFFTTKEVGKGSGQGLAIAHSVIVEQHDGKIWVDSDAGKGTRFTILLPNEGIQDDKVLSIAS